MVGTCTLETTRNPGEEVRHDLVVAEWSTSRRKGVGQTLDATEVVGCRHVILLQSSQLHADLHGTCSGLRRVEAMKCVPHLFGCFQEQALAEDVRGERREDRTKDRLILLTPLHICRIGHRRGIHHGSRHRLRWTCFGAVNEADESLTSEVGQDLCLP